MNRLTSRGILAVALGVILAQAPALAQTKSSVDTFKDYSVEKKNEAMAEGKKLMNDFDAKVKSLETQVSKDTSAASADAKRQLNDLKAARTQTAKKLDDMGKASAQASAQSWNDAKKAFTDSYKDLHKAYDDLVAKARK